MPAGKLFIKGFVVRRPRLPDCSCIDLLLRDRKNDNALLPVSRIEEVREKVNEALVLYIGAINSTPLITTTVAKQRLNKVRTAALRLLANPYNEHWMEKLLANLSINDLGLHVKDALHRYVKSKGGEIFQLERQLKDFCGVISERNSKKTLRILSKIQPSEITGKGTLRDPYLFRLVWILAGIWKEVTGSSYLPKTISRSSNEKIFLFAEWLEEIIRLANNNLPSNQQMKMPSPGSIYDILKIQIRNSEKF